MTEAGTGAEAEDRTQAPSKRRRQLARESGQVAHSPELTAAAGLLAAAAVLSVWGPDLAAALAEPFRGPGPLPVVTDAAEVVARLRRLALGVAWPLGAVIGASAAAAVVAHEAQVGALSAPGLLAPDPSRLWTPGQGPGLAGRAARGLWSVAKAVVVATVAVAVVRSDWPAFQRLGDLDTPGLVRAAGDALRHLTFTLAAATLALGLVDFALQYARFEAMMRVTPRESREDLRSTEGDATLRARRRRIIRSWRNDPAEVLAGATLVVTGPAGLTVVLAGGPPPRPVSVRSAVSGVSGDRLRLASAAAGIPEVSAPILARRIAQRRPPDLPPSPEILAALNLLWPAETPPEAHASPS